MYGRRKIRHRQRRPQIAEIRDERKTELLREREPDDKIAGRPMARQHDVVLGLPKCALADPDRGKRPKDFAVRKDERHRRRSNDLTDRPLDSALACWLVAFDDRRCWRPRLENGRLAGQRLASDGVDATRRMLRSDDRNVPAEIWKQARELTHSGRDDAMIRHLVSLCKELNVATVAEMVETREVADALAKAGVDYAQGWLFGQPDREPQGLAEPQIARAARRRGTVDQWG